MDLTLSYNDILLEPNHVCSLYSRSNIDPYLPNTKNLPIVSAPMPSIVTASNSKSFMQAGGSDLHAVFCYRGESEEDKLLMISHGIEPSIGLEDDFSILALKIEAYIDAGAESVLIDVANGATISVIDQLLFLQAYRPQLDIWAGNVASVEAYASLALLCDYIRVGIGGGAACTTRVNTGIGAGNVSSLLAISKYRNLLTSSLNPLDIPDPAYIVADGGISNTGDIVKALACGADLVMLGKMLAATTESAATYMVNETGTYKKYSGLASIEHNAKNPRWSPEGVSGWIRETGSLSEFLSHTEMNLRSAMAYLNAPALGSIPRNANILRVTSQGHSEGLPRIS